MHANILWESARYRSLENCLIKTFADCIIIESSIAGTYEEQPYHADYFLQTNERWQTQSLKIDFQLGDSRKLIHLKKQKDCWMLNDEVREDFSDCVDVDIAITPFTNSLPIRRLEMETGQIQNINVIYFDLPGNDIKRVQQQYIKLSGSLYHYENVPNDYEADITVDEFGLVDDYPSLFSRKELFLSKYIREAV